MKHCFFIAVFSTLSVLPTLSAGESSSADYTIQTDNLDSGGATSAGGVYSQIASIGGIVGVSSASSPILTAKAGYVGQLYEVVALEVTGPTDVNETASAQLGVFQILDDDSTLTLDANDVVWSIDQGPITKISDSGEATTDEVYANTIATANADYAGLSGTLDVNVLDTIFDNYRGYGGDGLGDDWQVFYFGEGNPLAGATFDPDGDGQDNAFEYTAGLVPNDANSKFTTSIMPVVGQPTRMDVIFDPIVAGRDYVVKAKAALTDSTWDTLSSSSVNTVGVERTVTDQSATGDAKFYVVEITNP